MLNLAVLPVARRQGLGERLLRTALQEAEKTGINPLSELPLLFEKLKGGGTLGQSVPKLESAQTVEKEEN